MEAEVECPYCGETTAIALDEAGGRMVEDCTVCCRPIDVSARVNADGEVSIRVRRGDG